MNKLYKTLTLIIVSFFTLSAVANDELEVSFGKKEVLIDNNKVQMVRLTYPVGSESGFHTHEFPHRTVYVISAGKLAFISKDNELPIKVIDLKVGQALYVPSATHNIKNVGSTEIVIVETEIK